jgi:hypothetical protein
MVSDGERLVRPWLPLEDRTLHNELDGYADYARRVKYKLVPAIW